MLLSIWKYPTNAKEKMDEVMRMIHVAEKILALL